MIYRTYFTKDNSLHSSNPNSNLGGDPVLELGCGGIYGHYSRVIFHFDMARLKDLIKTKSIPNNNIKHVLRLYNTFKFDVDMLGNKNTRPDSLPSSFVIELFKLKEPWDEGNGYSLKSKNIVSTNTRYSEQASNFINAKTNLPWSVDYASETLKEIHFDLGDDNLDIDMTGHINDIMDSDEEFYGFGLKYKDLEASITDYNYVISFFGKDTHTYFKPHIETSWVEKFHDNRDKFYNDAPNKLMLYTNIKENPINLDNLPSSVEIIDDNDAVVKTITDVKHEALGVYSVVVEDLQTRGNYYDKWDGLIYNGKPLPSVEMEFSVMESYLLNFGSKLKRPNDIVNTKLGIYGIKDGEFIKTDEVRKLMVSTTNFNGACDDEIFMDLYIKQADAKIFIIDREPFNKGGGQNYKYIDFSWILPQQYYIDFHILSNGTYQFIKTTKFSVISSMKDNKSNTFVYSYDYAYLTDPMGNFITNNSDEFITVKSKLLDN